MLCQVREEKERRKGKGKEAMPSSAPRLFLKNSAGRKFEADSTPPAFLHGEEREKEKKKKKEEKRSSSGRPSRTEFEVSRRKNKKKKKKGGGRMQCRGHVRSLLLIWQG